MDKNSKVFTQGYHYISEGIILFFMALLLIRFTEGHDISFWSYFIVLLSSVIIFAILSYYEVQRIIYIFPFTVLLAGFYFTGFPLLLSLLFSAVLSYRYDRLEKASTFHGETSYLVMSTLLAALTFIFMRDLNIFWLLIVHYIIILLGYYVRHLIPVQAQGERARYISTGGVVAATLIGIGAVVTIVYSEVFSRIVGFIWQGLSFLTVHIASFAAYLLQFLPINPPEVEIEGDDDGYFKSELGESVTESIEGFAVVFLLIGIGILLLFLYFLYRTIRRTRGEKEGRSTVETYEMNGEEVKYRSTFADRVRSLFKKPEHPARKLVFEFERKLAKTDHRRRPFETIESWLARIGRGTELRIYQKVRYGNKQVNEEEVRILRTELDMLADKLK